MANLISFRYRNEGNSDLISGLTVNYSVQAVAVLSNTEKKYGEELQLPSQRGGIFYTEPLLTGVETTNASGIIEVDVTNAFTETMFIKVYEKYGNLKEYNVSLFITLTTEKQEISPFIYLGKTEKPEELLAYNVYKDGSDYKYSDLDYWDEFDDFFVPEVVISESLLIEYQKRKIESQNKYLLSLQDFQGEIESQSILLIPTLNRFNPINFTNIITRCLELSVGTIENALEYTTEAGLIAETNRLSGIKTTISQISSLYPTITIDQGEGLPYQNIGVTPEPFRGYSFYQNSGIISFIGVLMDNYIPYIKEDDILSYPSLSLNGLVIQSGEFKQTSYIYPEVETQKWNFSFIFENIEDIVIKWQNDNKIDVVGLVSGDVLSVTSYVISNSSVKNNGEEPTTPGVSPTEYTTSIVIK
jgi:hypothetical protein